LIFITAKFQILPEHAEAWPDISREFTEATRAEEGCLSYDLYESGAAPGVFVTMERWVDQAAMDAHLQMPHLAEAFAAADGALAGEVAIHPLIPVDAG